MFLMYRVELKGMAVYIYTERRDEFLMYRVELKDEVLQSEPPPPIPFLMYRVELKARPHRWTLPD